MSFINYDKNESFPYELLIESADYLKSKISFTPKIGIICGSGLGLLGKIVENSIPIRYEEIPNFPVSGVEGHSGQLLLGYMSNVPVMLMQGRSHHYEGHPLWKCSFPVRVMKLMGVSHLIVTNAAGGINPNFKIGDIMLFKDHINFMGFSGNNPLQGLNDKRFGPRFVSMIRAYNPDLIKIGKEIGKELNISDQIQEGIFTCVGGPNFETIAENKFFHSIGVDAVGMSTIYEVITARHCEMEVFGFSLITNKCLLNYDNLDDDTDHSEVLDVGKKFEKIIQSFIKRIVEKIYKLN